jgi:membrane fusion protein (multidrug efflux system)
MSNTAQIIERVAFKKPAAPDVPPAEAKHANPLLRKRKILLAGLAATVLLAAAGGVAYWQLVLSHYASTDNAYVGASLAQINSQVTGPLAEVRVEETQFVRKGDILAIIEPSDAKIALARAEADYQHTLQRVTQYYAQRAVAEATMQARAADVEKTADDYARRKALVETGAVSRVEVTNAKTAADAAQANFVAAKQSLAAQDALIRDVDTQSHPETLASLSALEKARLDLSRTVIVAPIDGIVSQRKAQVGQTVQPGQSLMTITPITEVYVDANFKEGQLTRVGVGQSVTLTSDLYGSDVVYHGRVAGVGGGTGSAFAVIPAQNATGNWIKVVQRLPVRISLERDELERHPLRVGLSMTATIDTRTSAE